MTGQKQLRGHRESQDLQEHCPGEGSSYFSAHKVLERAVDAPRAIWN